jgi:hypothetical protein
MDGKGRCTLELCIFDGGYGTLNSLFAKDAGNDGSGQFQKRRSHLLFTAFCDFFYQGMFFCFSRRRNICVFRLEKQMEKHKEKQDKQTKFSLFS